MTFFAVNYNLLKADVIFGVFRQIPRHETFQPLQRDISVGFRLSSVLRNVSLFIWWRNPIKSWLGFYYHRDFLCRQSEWPIHGGIMARRKKFNLHSVKFAWRFRTGCRVVSTQEPDVLSKIYEDSSERRKCHDILRGLKKYLNNYWRVHNSERPLFMTHILGWAEMNAFGWKAFCLRNIQNACEKPASEVNADKKNGGKRCIPKIHFIYKLSDSCEFFLNGFSDDSIVNKEFGVQWLSVVQARKDGWESH